MNVLTINFEVTFLFIIIIGDYTKQTNRYIRLKHILLHILLVYNNISLAIVDNLLK